MGAALIVIIGIVVILIVVAAVVAAVLLNTRATTAKNFELGGKWKVGKNDLIDFSNRQTVTGPNFFEERKAELRDGHFTITDAGGAIVTVQFTPKDGTPEPAVTLDVVTREEGNFEASRDDTTLTSTDYTKAVLRVDQSETNYYTIAFTKAYF